VIMNTALRRENVNAVYLALHAKTLKDLLYCVREIPIRGLSITMPYKQAILEFLDNTDAHTTKIGACNTVVRGQDGKLYGFNTDTAGVVRPLEQRITIEGAKVLVLGAGGAARAAVFGLKERGAEVWILNRSAAPAQKLARQAKARTIKRPDLRKLTFDVIINATPVGMTNSVDPSCRSTAIASDWLLLRFARFRQRNRARCLLITGSAAKGRPNSCNPTRRASCGRSLIRVFAKKPSRTTCSRVARSSVVETVLASKLDPREGTAIGTSGNDSSSNKAILALEAAWTSARNCQESTDLPSAASLA